MPYQRFRKHHSLSRCSFSMLIILFLALYMEQKINTNLMIVMARPSAYMSDSLNRTHTSSYNKSPVSNSTQNNHQLKSDHNSSVKNDTTMNPFSSQALNSNEGTRENSLRSKDRFLYRLAPSTQLRESSEDEEVNQEPNKLGKEDARSAFFSLKPKPQIKAPLLPDEERRKVWLAKHKNHHGGPSKNNANEEEFDQMDRPVLKLNETNGSNFANHSCVTSPFKHRIRMTGCTPKIIINKFCHGSCTSFYIPQLRPKKLKASFRSCSACVPSESDNIQVRLECPEREEKEIYRTVMLVKKCECRAIDIGDDGE